MSRLGLVPMDLGCVPSCKEHKMDQIIVKYMHDWPPNKVQRVEIFPCILAFRSEPVIRSYRI